MRYKAQVDAEAERIATFDKGVEKGIEKTALGMKAENIPLDIIVKITGLTPEQVAAL